MRRLSLLLLLCAALPVGAQVRLARTTDLLTAPDGRAVGSLQSGTSWRAGPKRAGATQVTLEGWIESARVGARRDSFPQTVAAGATVRVRATGAAGGRVVGVLVGGAGIRVLERRGAWSRVRRTGWVRDAAIARTEERAPATARPSGTASATPEGPGGEPEAEPVGPQGRLRTARPLELRVAPGSTAITTLPRGTVVTPLGRDRGWVRVQVEGWLPESLVTPADSSYAAALRAVDLRLDPNGTRGRTVRWHVQVIGLQKADPLRRGLQADEPYLLALGPEGENTVLYLAVPPELLAAARALPAMADVLVTARVRLGRSEPTGAPILDLLPLSRR